MKKNKSGFILAETLVVATFVLTTLIAIYIQFMNINKSYQTTFQHNTVEGLYNTNQIRTFISANELPELKSAFVGSNITFLDLTACPTSYLLEYNYCKALFRELKVKQVLYVGGTFATLKKEAPTITTIDEGMKEFIQYTPIKEENPHLLLVEFENNTYATLNY